ncbi:sugar-binding transcriptional regulator [Lentzea sp. NPDC058450]|uniref:sugar-binding transcriptional regulator n=1 Tax=Lentzea sp. NPDC058450 TaxID=3346505 RepID=UPI00366979A6
MTGSGNGSQREQQPRITPQLLYAVGALYYLEEQTQAQIATRLGTSRPTVSRLLAEARRQGVVRIELVAPGSEDDASLAEQVRVALGLQKVHLAPFAPRAVVGASLASALTRALRSMDLQSDDVLLVGSGRAVYEVAQSDLPELPGVTIVPTVGGQDDPEPWYQTNEVTRQIAAKVGGRPVFLYAPALPGPDLHEKLMDDPSFTRVQELWGRARCAVVGVGAPPAARRSLPSFVPKDAPWIKEAVGDVCTRFFGADGQPLVFEGSDRVVSTSLEVLRAVPTVIAVASGHEKVASILAAAGAGWFTELVTDSLTASELLDAANGRLAS